MKYTKFEDFTLNEFYLWKYDDDNDWRLLIQFIYKKEQYYFKVIKNFTNIAYYKEHHIVWPNMPRTHEKSWTICDNNGSIFQPLTKLDKIKYL